MDKIISLMITAVMTVTSCSFKGENPLDGKRIAFIGDSISYGTNWQGGYGKLIGEQYNMNVTNFSKGGATLADNVHWSENSDGYRPYITDMLDNLDGDYEYIIAEGGLNDFWGHSELGEITDGFSGDFDENTMTVKINPDYQNIIENVVIPSTHNGKSVTAIASAGFKDCVKLKSIEIANGVTGIYDRAFVGCTSLKSITIPSSVKYIGRYAFDKSLDELYFEDNAIWQLYYGTVPVYDAAGGGYLYQSSNKIKVTANIKARTNERNIYFKEKQQYGYGSTNCYYIDSYNSYGWSKQ